MIAVLAAIPVLPFSNRHQADVVLLRQRLLGQGRATDLLTQPGRGARLLVNGGSSHDQPPRLPCQTQAQPLECKPRLEQGKPSWS